MDNNQIINEVNLVSIMHNYFVENENKFTKEENHLLVFEKAAHQLLKQEKTKLDEPSVWDFFIKVLGNNSDKLSELEREKTYHSLSKIIPDFEALYLKNVFCISNYNAKWPEFYLHKRINLYANIVGVEKVINRINEVYQESIQNDKPVKENDLIWGWLQPINNIIEKNFNQLNYKIDYDNIDSNKSLIENFVHIKLLEMEIKLGKKPYVGEKTKDYIEQELKSAKDEVFEDFLDKKLISSSLDYFSMSQKLDVKPVQKNNVKI